MSDIAIRTKLIRDAAKSAGITQRAAETYYKMAEDTVQKEIMMNPSAYEFSDNDHSERINQEFEKLIANVGGSTKPKDVVEESDVIEDTGEAEEEFEDEMAEDAELMSGETEEVGGMDSDDVDALFGDSDESESETNEELESEIEDLIEEEPKKDNKEVPEEDLEASPEDVNSED